MKARVLVSLVACGALLMELAACGFGPPRLTQPGGDSDGWFGISLGGFDAGRRMALTSEVIVCVDRPGRVEIVDVSLKEVEGDLQVDGFAVRVNGPEYPDWMPEESTLWDVGFVEGAVWVDVVCADIDDDPEVDDDPETEETGGGSPPIGAWMHLGVQFSKTTDRTGRGSTLVVSYRPEGARRTRTMEVPFGLVLCEGDTHDDQGQRIEECDHLADDYYRR